LGKSKHLISWCSKICARSFNGYGTILQLILIGKINTEDNFDADSCRTKMNRIEFTILNYTQRNLFWISFDKYESCLPLIRCWINRKSVIPIQIWFDSTRFRKDFSVCRPNKSNGMEASKFSILSTFKKPLCRDKKKMKKNLCRDAKRLFFSTLFTSKPSQEARCKEVFFSTLFTSKPSQQEMQRGFFSTLLYIKTLQ